MPAGYAYNMDPTYGAVSMVSDEGKMTSGQQQQQQQQQSSSMKDDRVKESPSPIEHPKMQPQVSIDITV